MKVPKTVQGVALMGFAVTSPFYFQLIHLIMRNPDGQNDCCSCNCSQKVYGSNEPKVSKVIQYSEREFLDFIRFYGIDDFVQSLKLIHDFALYHTQLSFDTDEKNALFSLKVLWERMEKMKIS